MMVRQAGPFSLCLVLALILNACTGRATDSRQTAALYVLEREAVFDNALPVNTADPDATAYSYAAVQITRSAPELRTLMTPNLADRTGMSRFTGASFGVSSPWVERAEILSKESIGSDSWRYLIRFHLATSTGPAGTKMESITVTKVQEQYLISNIEEVKSGR